MSSTDESASGDALATLQLKSTAKWLVAATASIAAVIVGGLQLTSLGSLGEADWWLGVLALAAAALALGAAFKVLYQAVLVLGTTRPAIGTLEQSDRNDSGNYPDGDRIEDPADPLLMELVVLRRSELLGPGRDAIGALTDDYTEAGKALARGVRVTIQNRTYDPAVPADTAALQALVADLERRIRDVSDAAERFETSKQYQRLKDKFGLHALVFLVGIFSFAWLTILYPNWIPETAKVTTPVQVEVTVPSADAAIRAGLKKECADRVLTGVAVGGTLDAPVVVTRAQPGSKTQPGCPAHRLSNTHDLIVAPLPVSNRG